MVEKQRYSLDGFEMRSRVRGYSSRPTAAVVQNRATQASRREAQHSSQTVAQPTMRIQSNVQQPTPLPSGVHSVPSVKKVARPASPHKLRTIKAYALIAAAFTMISVGSFLTYQGFKGNQNVAVQAKVLAESVVLAEDDKPVNNGNYDETEPPKDLSTYKVAADMPRLVSIPDVGVLARVKRVGVDAKNEIKAPKNVFDVGWYEGSSKPGESGVVFLDGHVSGPTKGGIFWNLKKIDIGDTITIEKGDGKKLNYKVAAKEVYDVEAVDMAKALSPYDKTKKGLNIMTCNGKFDAKSQTYDKRLVVYAVAE
jgi:sortase (surface protein transpeptidase)